LNGLTDRDGLETFVGGLVFFVGGLAFFVGGLVFFDEGGLEDWSSFEEGAGIAHDVDGDDVVHPGVEGDDAAHEVEVVIGGVEDVEDVVGVPGVAVGAESGKLSVLVGFAKQFPPEPTRGLASSSSKEGTCDNNKDEGRG